jgi:hypothetical protein
VAQHFVLFAALLQFLLSAVFLVIAGVVLRYGSDAQRAAEADVVRQGFPAEILARHQVRFDESGAEALVPVAIGMCFGARAWLNLSGSGLGTMLSWILQPILLVGGGIVTASQVFARRSIASAFDKSGDAVLQRIDVSAMVDAAMASFPAWLHYLIATRFVLVTVGSLLVIVLLLPR